PALRGRVARGGRRRAGPAGGGERRAGVRVRTVSEEAPRQLTLARLRELGLQPDRDLGQHFLLDDNVLRVIDRLADLQPDDVVLEVGAGLGVLAAHLAPNVRHVHAVEIDRRLEEALQRSLQGFDNVELHWGDAMRMPLHALQPEPTAFVANLPYHVAAPLIL